MTSEAKINENTRMVCMGMSANSIGTVNNIAARQLTYRYNARLLLDAVHYAPHFSIDASRLLAVIFCSALPTSFTGLTLTALHRPDWTEYPLIACVRRVR